MSVHGLDSLNLPPAKIGNPNVPSIEDQIRELIQMLSPQGQPLGLRDLAGGGYLDGNVPGVGGDGPPYSTAPQGPQFGPLESGAFDVPQGIPVPPGGFDEPIDGADVTTGIPPNIPRPRPLELPTPEQAIPLQRPPELPTPEQAIPLSRPPELPTPEQAIPQPKPYNWTPDSYARENGIIPDEGGSGPAGRTQDNLDIPWTLQGDNLYEERIKQLIQMLLSGPGQ